MPVPDLTAMSALTSSLKATADIAKLIVGIRDEQMIREKAVELTTVIMSAQSGALAAQTAQFELIDRIRNLEQQVKDLEDWNLERQRYQLKEVAPAVFAYVTKPGMENGEPSHGICAACYQRGRKSLLQQETRDPGRVHYAVCHDCGAELILAGHRNETPSAQTGRVTRR